MEALIPDGTLLPTSLLDSRLHGNDERDTAKLRHSSEGRNPRDAALLVFLDTGFRRCDGRLFRSWGRISGCGSMRLLAALGMTFLGREVILGGTWLIEN